MNFQIIKQKEFTFEKEGKKVSGVVYSVSHKARVFQASTLNFSADDMSSKDGVLSIKCDIEVVKESYDELGVTRTALKLVPKMDLTLSAF